MASRVVVLPAEPVMATTVRPPVDRQRPTWARASPPRALRVESTRMSVNPAGAWTWRSTMASPAPAAAAASR